MDKWISPRRRGVTGWSVGRWTAPTLGRGAEDGAQSGLDIVDLGEFLLDQANHLGANRQPAGGTQQLEAAMEVVGEAAQASSRGESPLRGPPVNPSPGAGSAFTTAPTPAGSVRSHHQFQLSKPDGGLGHLPVTGRVRGCSGNSGSRPSPDPRRLAPPESSSTENRPSACRIRCKRGHSAPPRPSGTAAWPAAGRSASEPAAQPPPEGLPTPRRYSRVPRKSEPCPSTPFPAPLAPARFATPHPNLEQLRPPSAIWHPPAHHGVAYTDPTTVDAASSARVVCQAPETGHPGGLWPTGRYRSEPAYSG